MMMLQNLYLLYTKGYSWVKEMTLHIIIANHQRVVVIENRRITRHDNIKKTALDVVRQLILLMSQTHSLTFRTTPEALQWALYMWRKIRHHCFEHAKCSDRWCYSKLDQFSNISDISYFVVNVLSVFCFHHSEELSSQGFQNRCGDIIFWHHSIQRSDYSVMGLRVKLRGSD